jgi:ribosomal RNA assembly protein
MEYVRIPLDRVGVLVGKDAWVARDIVKAIGRGFSPEKACRLLTEGQTLRVTDLATKLGRSDKALHRQKSRLIGRGGRTREILEDTTRTHISIMGRTVSIIGDDEQVSIAQEAVDMIVRGVPHKVVYKYLERKSRELRDRDKEIWREA